MHDVRLWLVRLGKGTMKIIFLCVMIFPGTVLCNGCHKQTESGIYKGKLEIRGLCDNTTISIVEGTIDSSKVVSAWQNPITGKTYYNVFALGTPCTFPADIKEGEEFYFKIEAQPQACMVCRLYYPAPSKKLPVKAISKAK